LQEQRTALINQAVTRGLNPQVQMKDSGIEWLGTIPEHWEISKLSKITEDIGDGLHGTPNYVDKSEYFFINGNNLVNGTVKLGETAKYVSEDEYRKYYIPLNDRTILLSINGTIGNIAFFRGEKVILGKSAAYIKCKDDSAKYFLSYLFQSFAMSRYFDLQVTGTTIYNFSLKSLRNTPIPLPPADEKSAIVQFLDKKCGEIDKSIQFQKDTITFVQEYRTAIIAEAVTGKIDVRN
jgi:type I restriction enzyme S subunit